MKYQTSFSLLSLALSACVSAVPAPQPNNDCVFPIGTTGGANAKPAGRVFDIDGRVEYFAGTNAWWMGHLSSNSDVDIAMSEIANTQYKIVRVWGFGDVTDAGGPKPVPTAGATDPNLVYFQYLNSTGGYINYGPEGLQRLDYVVSAAEKYGLKLVLNFVNNWGDYGGIAAYNYAFGGNATTFFTDAMSQKVYRAYINTIVNRYKKSTAIFAWELANEPRCHGCDTSVIYNWATSVSEYIKSLDNSHMVTLGDEGWFAPADNIGDGSYAYSGAEGVDFEKNLGIKTLDYGVFHLYPDSWGYNYTWGTTFIEEHDAVGAKAGKPVILEEYGTPFPHNHTQTELPWQEAVVKSGLAADQIWQFGTYDLSIPATSIADVNTIYYNDTEYQLLGRFHAVQMLSKWVF